MKILKRRRDQRGMNIQRFGSAGMYSSLMNNKIVKELDKAAFIKFETPSSISFEESEYLHLFSDKCPIAVRLIQKSRIQIGEKINDHFSLLFVDDNYRMIFFVNSLQENYQSLSL